MTQTVGPCPWLGCHGALQTAIWQQVVAGNGLWQESGAQEISESLAGWQSGGELVRRTGSWSTSWRVLGDEVNVAARGRSHGDVPGATSVVGTDQRQPRIPCFVSTS